MKIAILVWGSLYWDPRDLQTTGPWFNDGPELPIEFARISGDGRLTLVIKPGFDTVPTLYIQSRFLDFEAARENLQQREGTDKPTNIGYINFVSGTSHARPNNQFVLQVLRVWNENHKFDIILWSDFAPLFTDKLDLPFTRENAINHVNQLPILKKTAAIEYIRRAPVQIATRYRAGILEHFVDF